MLPLGSAMVIPACGHKKKASLSQAELCFLVSDCAMLMAFPDGPACCGGRGFHEQSGNLRDFDIELHKVEIPQQSANSWLLCFSL